jgi:tryptophan-rich sensory protein
MVVSSRMLGSLGGNLGSFFFAPLLVNGAIFGLGLNRNHVPLPGIPPAWMVGAIWMLLFLGLGWARWLVLRTQSSTADGVMLVGVLCLLYPVYTVGFSYLSTGFWGGAATGALALAISLRAWRISPLASALLLILFAWLTYATVATGRVLFAGPS